MTAVNKDDVKEMLQSEMNTFKESMVSHMTYMIESAVSKSMAGNSEKLEALKVQIEPIAQTFANLNWGKKALMAIGIFFAGLAGLVLTIIEIYKALNNK